MEGQLKEFVEAYTTKGIHSYNDIVEYANSIKERLRIELNTGFVREIILHDGTLDNALLFITKHPAGMNLMNEIFWRHNDSGNKLDAEAVFSPQGKLFDMPSDDSMKIIDTFAKCLISELKQKKLKTNKDIFNYTCKEGFLSKHVKYALDGYKQNGGKIEIHPTYAVTKKKGYCISSDTWNKDYPTVSIKLGD
jgi:hypothetical protein